MPLHGLELAIQLGWSQTPDTLPVQLPECKNSRSVPPRPVSFSFFSLLLFLLLLFAFNFFPKGISLLFKALYLGWVMLSRNKIE